MRLPVVRGRPAIGRRALPVLALLPVARPAGAAPAPLRFRVLRQGSAIGTHQVSFAEADGLLTARTEVEIAVRMLGVTVNRYSHRFEEVWAGDRLRWAASRLDRNGTVLEMRAEARAGAILVQGTAGPYRLPAEAAPLSWWNARTFGRPFFDNDTGAPVTLTWTRSPLPGGGVLWRATGEEESEASYAADGTWIAWKTRAEDGSTVIYERA